MTAADKIQAARSIVAEFDESFFAHRKQFLRDALSEMADLADALAQENARLKAALEPFAKAITSIERLCGPREADDGINIRADALKRARAALGDAP